jgi:hypothetical protein
MKKEYELAKLKVKRRGPLPAFRDAAGRPVNGSAWESEDSKDEKTARTQEGPSDNNSNVL